jgi:hypothetical protein
MTLGACMMFDDRDDSLTCLEFILCVAGWGVVVTIISIIAIGLLKGCW